MARFRLNPNETATENLWRAVRTATADILRKSSVRIAQDDRDDVFDDLRAQVAALNTSLAVVGQKIDTLTDAIRELKEQRQ